MREQGPWQRFVTISARGPTGKTFTNVTTSWASRLTCATYKAHDRCPSHRYSSLSRPVLNGASGPHFGHAASVRCLTPASLLSTASLTLSQQPWHLARVPGRLRTTCRLALLESKRITLTLRFIGGWPRLLTWYITYVHGCRAPLTALIDKSVGDRPNMVLQQRSLILLHTFHCQHTTINPPTPDQAVNSPQQ